MNDIEVLKNAYETVRKGSNCERFEDNDGYFFFISDGKMAGGCNYTVGRAVSIASEYSDSVDGFDENAFISSTGYGKVLNIEDIWVDSEFRNRGYSRRIVEHAIEVANSLGAESVVLRACSDEGIPVGVLERIYAGCGFSIVQRTEFDGTIMVRNFEV